jgi:hypothetical protein
MQWIKSHCDNKNVTQDKTAIRIVERIGGTVVFPNALRMITGISH